MPQAGRTSDDTASGYFDLMERVKTPSRPRTGGQSQMEIQWPRIRLYLVGGCHPRGKVETWLLAAPDGSAVSAVERAQFFGFNKVGLGAARKAGRALVQGLLEGHRSFIARVLVTGEPGQPEEVLEAWRLEGDRPVHVGPYSFE